MEYKILEAYRNKENDNWNILSGIAGAVILGVGIFLEKTPGTIGGATVISLPVINHIFSYSQAYMEARLDYLANERFTKLEEKQGVEELIKKSLEP